MNIACADPATGAMAGSIRLQVQSVLQLANFTAYELCSDELKNLCWSLCFQSFLLFSIHIVPLLTWSKEVDAERNREGYKRRARSSDSPIACSSVRHKRTPSMIIYQCILLNLFFFFSFSFPCSNVNRVNLEHRPHAYKSKCYSCS